MNRKATKEFCMLQTSNRRRHQSQCCRQ